MTVLPLSADPTFDRAARDRRLVDIAGNLHAALRAERHGGGPEDPERVGLDRIDEYVRGVQDQPYRPDEQDSAEYKAIMARSIENVLPLILSSLEQNLHVTGYRRSDTRNNASAWTAWQRNGWDSRQSQLHRAALQYGVAYSVVLPGRIAGQSMPTMRPVSPRRMIAVYDDQAADEWPRFALEEVGELDPQGRRRVFLRLYTDGAVHDLDLGDGASPEVHRVRDASREHKTGLVPVVRFPCELDLEGRYVGEIAPLIKFQDQNNQASFDEAITRSAGAFVVKFATGITLPGSPGTEEGGEEGDRAAARQAKLRLAADRLLTAQDPDAAFGSLPATPLAGHLASHDAKLRNIALRAQLAPHTLLGGTANISAEALAATNDGMHRKARGHRITLGECHERQMRLVAWQSGDREGWDDHDAAMMWGDTEARSLAQVADAIVKLADSAGLRVDPDLLLPYLPGWTQLDVDQAAAYRAQRRAEDPLVELDAELRRQADGSGARGAQGVSGHDPSSRIGEAS